MVREKEDSGRVEWRINMGDGTSKVVTPKLVTAEKIWVWLKSLIGGFILKLGSFLHKAWDIAVADPRKVIHCLKVGLALSLVSLSYYTRPLYKSVGVNAIWAVMTVVVVFEYTVGATLYKCINRVAATCLAGALGLGAHWIANKSGERFEPYILEISVFLLGATATFSRFLPSIKAQFDYGVTIFILTFSLVSVSGYHVDKLFDMAYQRLLTIVIGVVLCIIVSMVLCPVWAGDEVHHLINQNLEKLAASLDGCAAAYLNEENEDLTSKEDTDKKISSYRCVLNSKATEEPMAKFATWEPAHGSFSFRHPWKQYLKIGALTRSCAYCIEALKDCTDSKTQAPDHLKLHIGDACMTVSSSSSDVLKELAISVKTMTKSSNTDFLVTEMNSAVQELQSILRSPPNSIIAPTSEIPNVAQNETLTRAPIPPLAFSGVLPLITSASLLIEIAARIKEIVGAVNELSSMAEFKTAMDDNSNQEHQLKKPTLDKQDN